MNLELFDRNSVVLKEMALYDGDPSDDIKLAEDGTYFNDLTMVSTGGMIDCGAYTGDSIQSFVNTYGKSAYHKQEDLITLPQFIASCKNENFKYDVFLRHHGCTVPELVLYGIPRKR